MSLVPGLGLGLGLVDFDRIRIRLELERVLATGDAALSGARPGRFDAATVTVTAAVTAAAAAPTAPIQAIDISRATACAHTGIERDRGVVESRDLTARFDAACAWLLERESGLRGCRR